MESIPDVRVVETARDGQEALRKTLRLRPDLITLDLEMPLMDGFTFLRWVMNSLPTPVIVVSAQEADENVFKAMDLGAVDFILKPTRHASTLLEDIRADLIERVLAIPLLKMRRMKERMESEVHRTEEVLQRASLTGRPRMIGIASSTGGPPAIQTILKELPDDFDIPILIAQHMPPGFTGLFAERLNKHTALQVQEAADELPIRPRNVYLAPGGKHLVIEKRGDSFCTRIQERQADSKYSPSANLLFGSMAQQLEAPAIGAVLTGMGDDGREGLKQIKAKGGVTIAESEQTAIILGCRKKRSDPES